MKKEWKTAAQLRAELEADPEYRARLAVAERVHRAKVAEFARATRPIVDALRAVGLQLDSLDLSMSAQEFGRAIPVLLEQLRQGHPAQVKATILRALARSEAKMVWSELVEMLRSNSLQLPQDQTYLIAAALEAAADESVLDDVLRLVGDRSLGVARAPLLHALQRSESPRAKILLMELARDPDLAKEVKRLRRLSRMRGAVQARDWDS